MPRKKRISKEESELFRNAVSDVDPLQQDKTRHRPKKSPPIKMPTGKKPTATIPWEANLTAEDWLSGEDSLHFVKSGIQHKTIQRLKRGQIPIEATIDLHRQTTSEAMENIAKFIEHNVVKGNQWLRIVHGKGRLSTTGKPVLKNFLNQWLREQPDVLAFHSAKAKHGGTGALYVLLKKRP